MNINSQGNSSNRPVSGPYKEKFCHECGERIRFNAEICPHCGVRQPGMIQPSRNHHSRNRIVAALFAIFLGNFGIHKFYLGRIVLGIVYLVLFWTIIPGIIAFFEGIWYLIMSDDDFETRYGTSSIRR